MRKESTGINKIRHNYTRINWAEQPKARITGPLKWQEEKSCFHRFDNENQVIVVRDGIGEKSRFMQGTSHFR